MFGLGFVSAGYRYQLGDVGPGGGIVYMLPGQYIDYFGGITNSTVDYFEIPDEDWYDGTDDPEAPWGCFGTELGASGENFGDGVLNTSIILSGCATAGIAARLCSNWSNDGYDDWFFPSMYELVSAVINNIDFSLGLTFGNPNPTYWSSTETYTDTARTVSYLGGLGGGSAKYGNLGVRPVRSFEARYV